MNPSFDRWAFARRFAKIRGGCPQAAWAKRIGLSYAAVRDLEQGRVNPSRATILLVNAIELSPSFMRDVAERAQDDLARLGNRGRTGIYTGDKPRFAADEAQAANGGDQ